MTAWIVSISILLFLFFVWFTLKSTGRIGRQFSDGLNTSKNFAITSVDQNFEVKIQPYKRGVYRYKSYLVFDGKDFSSDTHSQNIEVKFTETICGSTEVIGSSHLSIKSIPGRSSTKGLGRYGKVTKTSYFKSACFLRAGKIQSIFR